MNTTKMSEESAIAQPLKALSAAKTHTTDGRETGIMETRSTATTLSQRLAIGFTAGVVASLALVPKP
jgi:hypothetical protein